MIIKEEVLDNLIDKIKYELDAHKRLILEDDEEKAKRFIYRLCNCANELCIDWGYYKDVLVFNEPISIEKELIRIKADHNVDFRAKRKQILTDDIAGWVLNKARRTELTISLTKERMIFCDSCGYSSSFCNPEQMQWFILDWLKGLFEYE